MDRGVGMTVPSAARCFTTIAVFLMLFSQVTGNLVVVPKNQVTAVGQSVQLNCSTDDKISVNWLHFPLGSTASKDVYISRRIVSPYYPRFTVQNGIIIQERSLGNNITAYNLLITDVRMEDAGTYRCVDRTGMGEQRDAELTVLGSLPKCTTNIGPDGFICEHDCHNPIDPIDKIHCSCTIEYAGNIAPEMKWKTTSGQDTIQPQPNTSISEKTVSSQLNITATKSMDGASVVWYSTQSTQINWISMAIKILYAKQNLTTLILSQSQIVTCSANGSQHCSYTWIVKTDPDNELKTVEGRTLKVNQPGTYLCETNCPFRHTMCTFIAMHVEYKNGDKCNKNLLWVFGGVNVILVVALVIVTFFMFKLRMKRHKTPDSPSRKGIPPITNPSDNVALLRLNMNGTSSSSSNGSSQSGSDEEKSHMKVKPNGICNSSAPSPA